MTQEYKTLSSVRHHNSRQGAMIVMVIVLLPVLLILAAFAVNLAHLESTNTEIQVACDAAARAAGRTYVITGSRADAIAAAREAAAENPIGSGGYVLPIADSDVTVGRSTRPAPGGPYVFTAANTGNSIRVMTSSLANGSGLALKPVLPIMGLQTEIRPLLTSISTQTDIDVALVIDRSGSMAYGVNEVAVYPPTPAAAPAGWDFGDPVPPNSRWLDLESAVQIFLSTLSNSPQEELVSLTLYNESSSSPVALTANYGDVVSPLFNLSSAFDSGGTNIGGGMLQAVSTLSGSNSRADATKVIVLMTDGVHNSGKNPINAANSIADQGVTVFTVTFSDEAKQADMAQVADICGGKHFHASDSAQLQQAFVDIAKFLPTLITE